MWRIAHFCAAISQCETTNDDAEAQTIGQRVLQILLHILQSVFSSPARFSAGKPRPTGRRAARLKTFFILQLRPATEPAVPRQQATWMWQGSCAARDEC
jgi:hypothetical protein